jgi:hypothetical protein
VAEYPPLPPPVEVIVANTEEKPIVEASEGPLLFVEPVPPAPTVTVYAVFEINESADAEALSL